MTDGYRRGESAVGTDRPMRAPAGNRMTTTYDPERFWESRYSRFDLSSSGHRDLPERYNYWLYERKKALVLGALRREHVSPLSCDVLDVGCGTGVYAAMWKAARSRSLTGFDITAASVEKLRPQYPDFHFYKEDIADPGLWSRHPSAFDIVTALDVLYHVVDDAKFSQAIVNISRLCRSGGVLLIHDAFLNGSDQHHGYIRWRSFAAYRTHLEDAGFEIRHRLPIFLSMIQPIEWRRRLLTDIHRRSWKTLSLVIDKWPDLAGRVLFNVDSLLCRALKDGPSMELLVCRKK